MNKRVACYKSGLCEYGHATLAEASRGRLAEPCVKQLLFPQGSESEQLRISLRMITSKENQGGKVRRKGGAKNPGEVQNMSQIF